MENLNGVLSDNDSTINGNMEDLEKYLRGTV